MKFQVDLPDDYAESLSLLAMDLERRSRHKLACDILCAFVDDHPKVLEQVRSGERRAVPLVSVRIAEPSVFDGSPRVKWILTRYDDVEMTGTGRVPQEAASDVMGRELSGVEFKELFKACRPANGQANI